MPIVHVVSFKYKDSVSSEERTELYNQFGTFQTKCLYTNNKPYILDFKSSTQNISPENAALQVRRVATARGLPEERLRQLVTEQTRQPALGFLGEPRVNVLALNRQLARLGADTAR